jgi:hypothetical protein
MDTRSSGSIAVFQFRVFVIYYADYSLAADPMLPGITGGLVFLGLDANCFTAQDFD